MDLAAGQRGVSMISCPLCGWEFDPLRENCHTGCPFNKGCTMIMCPGCGYEFLTESRIVNQFKALLKYLQKKQDEVPTRS